MNKTFPKIIITAALALTAGISAHELKDVKNMPFSQSNAVCSASATLEPLAERMSMHHFLSPKMIEFYETNIAKEKVVSNISAKKIEKMAKQFNIEPAKMKTVLILNDFMSRQGTKVDIKKLAAMSDAELLKLGKESVEKYIASLTPEQKADLDSKFAELKKRKD